MTAESLVTRMICSNARLNFKNLRDGLLNANDFQRITQTAGKLHKARCILMTRRGCLFCNCEPRRVECIPSMG